MELHKITLCSIIFTAIIIHRSRSCEALFQSWISHLCLWLTVMFSLHLLLLDRLNWGRLLALKPTTLMLMIWWSFCKPRSSLILRLMVLSSLIVLVVKAVVIWNGLKHVEPDRSFFRFEVSRLQSYGWIGIHAKWMDISAGGRQEGSHLQSSFLTASNDMHSSFIVLYVGGFVVIDLVEEVWKPVYLCLILDLKKSLPLKFRYSDFQFCKTLSTVERTIDNFVFCVHQIIVVKVDGLSSSLCIGQVFFKSFLVLTIGFTLLQVWHVIDPI